MAREKPFSLSRPRGEGAENHSDPAAEATQGLGEFVDAIGGERDDRGARRKALQGTPPGASKLGHPHGPPDRGVRDELVVSAPHTLPPLSSAAGR